MKRIILSIFALWAMCYMQAQTCDLHIQVVKPTAEMCDDNEAIANLVQTRLIKALTIDGVSAGENYGQFYISGRFDDLYKETLPGPPVQTVLNTSLTLMVADIFDNKVFASETFDLKGVGTSEQRAYINALNQINARNNRFEQFINNASKKVISYFDANYTKLLAKAESAAKMQDYEKALYFASLIPECSKGYPAAEKALQSYYQKFIDDLGTQLLRRARGEFSMKPNAEGAAKAYEYLYQISINSSAYPAAESFARQIEKQTKIEYDFEVHKKYEDALATERAKIDAARQIGVAYGNGQRDNTTNILWK